MKSKKALILILALAMVALLAFAACSPSGDSGGDAATEESSDAAAEDTGDAAAEESGDDGAAAPGEVAGFEEFPIGDDIELGPLNVAGVYFQPVDMEPAGNSLPAAESDMHMEADISALENDLGYGVGNFVPNLPVRYEVLNEDGSMAAEGAFMPMSASDGPHYGANVKIGEAGTYKVRFIIDSPEEQGYLLHTDATTGVTGKFWTEPLVAEWDFDWVPRTW
ncbi:MAG: iron transporter [Clostridiales Family XIII bacterium]|jgi:uncharacterized protein involved in high-affinity Fe2+ transport|nr:iron transporter [Clostridiales Family XIII bacterium]